MIRFLLLLLWWGRNDYHFNHICSSALVFCIQQLLLFLLFMAVEFPFRIFGKKSWPKNWVFLIFVLIATAMNRCVSVCFLCFWYFLLLFHESLQWPRNQAIQGASTRWSHFPRFPKLPAPFIVGGTVVWYTQSCWSPKTFFFFCLHPHIPLTFADSQIEENA
jgi:hypothetical protein